MKRVLFTSCLIVLALSGSLIAGEPHSQRTSRFVSQFPARTRSSTEIIFGQAPYLDEAGFGAVVSDSACNAVCAPVGAAAAAVASPGYDGAPLAFRVNEVEVWGIYLAGDWEPGAPPAEDSFTVRVHGGFVLPSPEVCSRPGIVGTREIVASVLGFDVYKHTLQLPAPCVVTAPDGRVWWIEVFNDTGPADDWAWIFGYETLAWPFDCCLNFSHYGTAVDGGNAPGVDFSPWYQRPLAFLAYITDVGEAQGLRLAKPSDDELLLQWDTDCGGGGDYSVYRGSLATGYASLAPEPGQCDVSATSAVLPAGDDAADFFLVVPWVAACAGCLCDPAEASCRAQGSYGADSSGNPRPEPAAHCYELAPPQNLDECAP